MSKNTSPLQVIKFLPVILALIILSFLTSELPEKMYCYFKIEKGIELLHNGSYDESLKIFQELYDKKYYDARELCDYINYLQCQNTDLAQERYYLNAIPDYYDGLLAEEITAEKAKLNKRYYEHIQKLKSETPQNPNKYKSELPFEGMPYMYIENTYMGKPYKVEKDEWFRSDNKCYDCYTYTWCTNNYDHYLLMRVTCVDYITECVVTTVTKYNLNFFWNMDTGMPDLNGTYEKSESSSNRNSYYVTDHSTPYDPYDVYDYSDFEDFYYDNEADFDGLDDAEDYYNEAWENFD